MNKAFTIRYESPDPIDYIRIRKSAGWGEISLSQSQKSLEHSCHVVCVYDAHTLVGMGRIVGDGVLYFYLSDVVVDPMVKGQGIGQLIMEELVAYLNKNALPFSTIAVLAAPNKEGFCHTHPR